MHKLEYFLCNCCLGQYSDIQVFLRARKRKAETVSVQREQRKFSRHKKRSGAELDFNYPGAFGKTKTFLTFSAHLMKTCLAFLEYRIL